MVAVPSFVSSNAKRGLKLLEYAGDGLKAQTVRDARSMASGSITAEKVRRMAAWLARHESDLSSPDAGAYLDGTKDRPTAGQVAWLLWGGDISTAQRDRARLWAERKRDQLIAEGELSKQIEKEVSATVSTALKRKVDEHNKKFGNTQSKRVTLSMLERVFERGVGAYNTNPSSVRPTVTSSDQWAYARVNAFLFAVRTGRYKSGAFDTDILPEGHPLSTRKNLEQTMDADKMYGYEMKDDDSEGYDPLDSLLNAYSAAVKMGPKTDELLGKIMEVITAVREMYVEDMMPENMKKNMHYDNPVECLTHAYIGLLNTSRADLRAMVMALIHEAEMIVYGGDSHNNEASDESSESDSVSEPVSDGSGTRSMVQRVVQEVGGQFCVLSETGRSFGCYAERDQADQRLAQIESFRSTKLVQASLNDLVSWHNKCHEVSTVSQALKSLHDLLEDEMEDRGHARPYSITSDEKIALLVDKSAGIVAKANEQRYTLGPWYVPGVEDAHGEFTDEDTLQKALWDWVRSGDRTIYLQHSDKPAGEMVEIMTVPFAVEADLTVPNQGVTKYQFPANTPFMGVVWEEWSWNLVKEGKLRGYSIGGSARRMSADLPESVLV
jgi:hypothetical protein